LRKLIAFDEDTFDKLRQLGRDRMATIQELADEAFADVLKKHGIPVDLKDALRKSAAIDRAPAKARRDQVPCEKPNRDGRLQFIGDRLVRGRPRLCLQPIFFRPFLNRGPLRA